MKNNLAEVRKILEMTQQEVSMVSGFTQGQICRWEKGKGMSLETAAKLSKALGVTIDALVDIPEGKEN